MDIVCRAWLEFSVENGNRGEKERRMQEDVVGCLHPDSLRAIES